MPVWPRATAGRTDPQNEGLKSWFPLSEPSPEAVLLAEVLPRWLATSQRTSFVLQPWCTSWPILEQKNQPSALCLLGTREKGLISATPSSLSETRIGSLKPPPPSQKLRARAFCRARTTSDPPNISMVLTATEPLWWQGLLSTPREKPNIRAERLLGAPSKAKVRIFLR